MEKEYLIVNHVWVKGGEVHVGATNSTRWKWDTDDGDTGANAKTIIWVDVKNIALESVTLFCSRYEKERGLAISGISELLNIAWDIKDQNLSNKKAHHKYFGFKIKSK